jgi:dihydropteroate synthase
MQPQKLNLDFSRPCVMAILNVTPDSFYAGSRSFSAEEIERRVVEMVAEGADWIDVGGYSSRPGAEDISPEEEFQRVSRAMTIIRRLNPEIPVSVDSFRSEVVERTVEAFGAVIVNDISGGVLDPRLVEVAARYALPYIAMHMRGTPQTMQQMTHYGDVVAEVVEWFRGRIDYLKGAGVDQLILDPGFGFAKTTEQNFQLLAGLHRLVELGYPVLSALSRKSMIYKTLGVGPEEALHGTTALHWESLRQGAKLLRVHDVRAARDVVQIFEKYSNKQ